MAEKKAIVKVEEQAIEPVRVKVDAKSIEEFLFTSETKLSEKQRALFLQLALRNQLDPFKREIYAIPFKDDFSIVTGYQVYIQRAETTGLLDGWHCEIIKGIEGELTGAKITIHRKDFEHSFEWEVSLKEFIKTKEGEPIRSWKTMPEFMIKKVCIGQGFRLAFPGEVGGLPYLQEEIEGSTPMEEKDVLVAHIDDGKIVTDSKPKVTPPATTSIDETVKSKIDTPVVPANTKPPIGPIPHKVFSKAMSPKEYMIYLLEAVEKLNKEFYDNTVQALVDAYGDKFPDNLPEAEYSKILTQLKPYVKSK